MNQRISELLGLINEEPEDPFLRYALALEYVKSGDLQNAGECFRFLLNNVPEYLPVYYHAAHFFWEKNDLEAARKAFEKGISIAKNNKDPKTLRELENAFNNFLNDMEDM